MPRAGGATCLAAHNGVSTPLWSASRGDAAEQTGAIVRISAISGRRQDADLVKGASCEDFFGYSGFG